MKSTLTNIPAGLLLDESGYPFTGLEPPPWIAGLDSFFAEQPIRTLADGPFRTCANLCRRTGDLDLYRRWLHNALTTNPSPWWCAAFATSMLVGYFSTGKSLLDAGSVSLNLLYALGFASRDQDFKKKKFWNALRTADPDGHKILRSHKELVDDAVRWRDAAVHRLPPRVRVLNAGPPSKLPEHTTMKDVRLGIPTSPEADIVDALLGKKLEWREPLEFVDEFSARFHAFAKDLADVMLSKLQLSWPSPAAGAG
jgi:hypothetical protein